MSIAETEQEFKYKYLETRNVEDVPDAHEIELDDMIKVRWLYWVNKIFKAMVVLSFIVYLPLRSKSSLAWDFFAPEPNRKLSEWCINNERLSRN